MNNIEIEMKYKITKKIYDEIIEYFKIENIKAEVEKQNDIYFSPIHFPFLGGEIDNECLRLRILENKNILSYKKFIPPTNNEPAHCIEHELEISDIEKLKLILNDLRIKKEITLKKERKIFIYKNNIEISLDIVDNLGHFIELEIINHENINEAVNEINGFIKKFKITESMRNYDGYSYLLFNEKNKESNDNI